MNARKAKALRKLVYDNADFRERQYVVEQVNKFIEIKDGVPLYEKRGILRNDGLRKYYQQLKKA